jgi:hypothetical protein
LFDTHCPINLTDTMFEQLDFQPHEIPGAIQGRYKFSNGWSISVVSGLPGCGLYGSVFDGTFEVAIFQPNGNMTEDVIGWNTKEEVSAMMKVLSHL